MVNIRDIAKGAGVGIATVSRYINGKGYVSDEVKKKIQMEIDKSGYVPNALARAVFTKNSKTIGLMIPNIINPFFNQLTTEVEKHLNENGYTILLCHTDDNEEKERECINIFKSHRVDGIIASRSQLKEEYLDTRIPIISFESNIDSSIITIASDNYKGGVMAFNYLYERGCRKLLHVKGPKTFEATQLRCKGFLDGAKKKKGLDVKLIEFETDFNTEMIMENLSEIKSFKEYDGVFVFNDIVATAVIKHLKKEHINIPEDIQVMGYDNSFICELLDPSLTTIDQNIKELGELAVKLLIGLIDEVNVDINNYIVDISLVKRETTLNLTNTS